MFPLRGSKWLGADGLWEPTTTMMMLKLMNRLLEFVMNWNRLITRLHYSFFPFPFPFHDRLQEFIFGSLLSSFFYHDRNVGKPRRSWGKQTTSFANAKINTQIIANAQSTPRTYGNHLKEFSSRDLLAFVRFLRCTGNFESHRRNVHIAQ